MSYTQKVLRGITVVFLFSLATNLLGYLLRLYLGRTLDTALFGLIYGVFALFGVVALFIYLGLNEAVVKFLSDFRARREEGKVSSVASSALAFELLLSIILCGLAFLFSDWLAAAYFKTPEAVPLIRIYALAVALSPIIVLFSALFQAYQKPLYYAGLNLAQALVLLLGTMALLPILGVSAAAVPYVVFYALAAIACAVLARRIAPRFKLSLRLVDSKAFWRVFLYSIPITLTTLSYAILVHTDTLMITYFRSLDDVGLYNAALPTANILLFFASSVTAVFFPVVAELWTKGRHALLEGAMRQAYVLIGAAIVPAAALFVVFPDVILNILFGGKFVPAAPALRILAIASIFTTLSMFNGAVLSGIGTPKRMAIAVVIGAAFNFFGNLVLIPKLGIIGAALATLISSFFIFIANTYGVLRGIRFKFPLRDWLLTLVAGGVLLVLVAYLREAVRLPLWWKLAIVLPLGLAAYALCLWLFRVVTLDEVKRMVVTTLKGKHL